MNNSIKKELSTITPRIDIETRCVFGFFIYICPHHSSDEVVRLDFSSKDIPIKYHWVLQAIAAPKIDEYAKEFWSPLKNLLNDELLTDFYNILYNLYFDKHGNISENPQLSSEAPAVE